MRETRVRVNRAREGKRARGIEIETDRERERERIRAKETDIERERDNYTELRSVPIKVHAARLPLVHTAAEALASRRAGRHASSQRLLL